MKVSRKQVALLISFLIFSVIVVHVSSNQTKFKASRSIALPPEAILDERCLPAVSANGKVGFITSVTTGSVMSFNTTSGRIMSSIIVGETAGAVSLVETDSRRLLAVPTANDPDHDRPASIAIIDATKPRELQIVTLIILPKVAHITPSTRVFFTSDGRMGVIASSFPEPTLYSFNTGTGQIISQLAIIGQPSEIALRTIGQRHLIAISSAAANSLSFINLDMNGLLNQISFFSPDKAQLSESNNPVISINGRIAYIAASEGEMLFSVDTASGTLINSLKVSSVPQKISLARNQYREELIAITRTRNNLSGQASGILIVASLRGQFYLKSNFEPPEQIEFSSVNNVFFSDDAMTAFVGSKSGMLFSFSTETGELHSHQWLGNEILTISVNSTIKKVITLKRSPSRDEVVISDFDIVGANETLDNKINTTDEANLNLALDSKKDINNSLTGKTLKSNDLPEIFMRDVMGNRIAVEASRVRFRSGKTLEIALDEKLTELIEKGSWKFKVDDNSSTELNTSNKKVYPQLTEALIKRSKNSNRILRLKINGENLQGSQIVEFLKAGVLVYRQSIESVSEDEVIVKIPEDKYSSLGRFSVRLINSNKLISNIVEVKLLKTDPLLIEDSQVDSEKTSDILKSKVFADSLTVKSIDNGIQVIVKTNSHCQYSDFTLSNPSRIVVDVTGAQTLPINKTFNIQSPYVSRIRLGQPSAGVLRIVLDSIKNTPYKIFRKEEQLIIITGNVVGG